MPSEGLRQTSRGLPILIGVLVLGLCLHVGPPFSPDATAGSPALWKEDEQRLRVALKIFPACLGAVEPRDANVAPNAPLSVLVAYAGPDDIARQTLASLADLESVRGRPLSVALVESQDLDRGAPSAPDAIFVTSVGLGGDRLRAWSERYRTLVFSPFAGDVEAGAVAGIHVAERILPAINMTQASRAQVRFKAFFLQVAHRHD